MNTSKRKIRMNGLNIYDGSIEKINIYTENYELMIDLYIKIINFPDLRVLLKFRNVKEYAFNWDCDYTFYYIRTYKFIKNKDFYYISFDPNEDVSDISQRDNDLILSKDLFCFYSDTPEMDFIPVETNILFRL